jgi:hypothetical protein
MEAANMVKRRKAERGLTREGKYTLLRHEDERDFEVRCGALEVAWWKLEHGGKIR